MKNTDSLINNLKCLLPWHPARIEIMAILMTGMIQIRSVNLKNIARTMPGSTLIDSRYKRLKRFFSDFNFSQETIARLIASWLLPSDHWVLCIDRTNWKFGKKDINILMVSVVHHHGMSIPILWQLLPKRGNSNTDERIQLITKFIRIFGSNRIDHLVADREFIGECWFKWLKDNNISFRIRLRSNFLAKHPNRTDSLKVYRYFSLQKNESMVLNQSRKLWGIPVYLSCYRSETERVIIASDQYTTSALNDYSQRWQIETLFQAFKGRGFDLEATRMVDSDRLDKLICVLIMSYCWAYKVGLWRHEQKPIKVLKHNRKARSIFSYGMEWLSDQLFSQNIMTDEFISLLPIDNQNVLRTGYD